MYLFPKRQRREKIVAKSFRPINMFYNSSMKHWLSLISLKAFHCKSYVQSKRGKAFFLVLSITHLPSNNIFSPNRYMQTLLICLEEKLLLVLNLLNSEFMIIYLLFVNVTVTDQLKGCRLAAVINKLGKC